MYGSPNCCRSGLDRAELFTWAQRLFFFHSPGSPVGWHWRAQGQAHWFGECWRETSVLSRRGSKKIRTLSACLINSMPPRLISLSRRQMWGLGARIPAAFLCVHRSTPEPTLPFSRSDKCCLGSVFPGLCQFSRYRGSFYFVVTKLPPKGSGSVFILKFRFPFFSIYLFYWLTR